MKTEFDIKQAASPALASTLRKLDRARRFENGKRGWNQLDDAQWVLQDRVPGRETELHPTKGWRTYRGR